VRVAELRRALAEARELSAQLCGQRNAKQKIQHVLQVKAERDALQRENARLAAQLRVALQHGMDGFFFN